MSPDLSLHGAPVPENPAANLYMQALRFRTSQQWDRALDTAREWLRLDPEEPEAHLTAALALVNLKRYPEAETHLGKLIAARPNSSFAHRLAAISYFNQKKTKLAEEHIARAIELSPNDAMNWYQVALMRYRQGSLDAAEKHASRARELQPDNADIINLMALCQRGNPHREREYYLHALELDPENAIVHTNLGSYYLNNTRDYAAAEECFRRALRINPAEPTAQKNLFIVLRLRDPLYRVLTFPMELVRGLSWNKRGRTTFARIGLLLLWLALGRIFFFMIVAWLLLIWPLLKAYEYITLSDIRAQAGIVGARRGGWKNFHRWPVWVRLGLFATLVACFWSGLLWLYASRAISLDLVTTIAAIGLIGLYGMVIFRWGKRTARRAQASRAEKKLHEQRLPRAEANSGLR